MSIGSTTVLGLLMAPDKLPSCFSCEESAVVPARCVAPPRRLRDLRRLVRRMLADRLAESRNRSAAAW